jgi:hypothetical protein
MDAQQPPEPPTPDYAVDDSKGGTFRRLATTAALAVLLMGMGLLAAIWVIALANGYVGLLSQYYELAPEFRGNHGPWRHVRVLRELYRYALGLTFFGALPLAFLAAIVDGSRRTGILVVSAMILLIVGVAHFPLFD